MAMRKILEGIWAEFVYGGHLLSLGAAGIIYSLMIILSLKVAWPLLLIMYLMPQIIYSYDHLKGAKGDAASNPERARHILKQKKQTVGKIFIYVIALISVILYLWNWRITLAVIAITLAGVFYTGFFKNISKTIPGFKNVFVALVWAGTPVMLVLIYFKTSFAPALLLLFMFVFLRSYSNAVFFDIKDIDDDRTNKIKTVPVVIGKGATLKYLHLINLLSFIPIASGVYFKIFPSFSLALGLLCFYTFFYLIRSKSTTPGRLRRISYIMADGEDILSPLALFISRALLR